MRLFSLAALEFSRQLWDMAKKVINDDPYHAERLAMVRGQIEARGIGDERVLEAMRRVPRHAFLPRGLWNQAYEDYPVPIGPRQTISQPYIVAFMAEALGLRGCEKVLEIGSGCGYALAILSCLCAAARGIELIPELCRDSQERLCTLGFSNIRVRSGDGYQGWVEEAPFDAILLSCAAPDIPPPLWDQLAEGGRFLFPRGGEFTFQELVLVTKTPKGPVAQHLEAVRFVPMRRE